MENIHISCVFVLIFLTWATNSTPILSPANTGINYGQVADNLPDPGLVVGLLQTNNIQKVKLYSVNQTVLKAFANTNIEIVVGLGNEFLASMKDPNQAFQWVNENIKAYLPATKITGIVIGNEVLTGSDTAMMQNLLPAMQNVHTALKNIGADMTIKITTAHSLAVLGNSFPPSAGAFTSAIASTMKPICNFLSQVGSSFYINAYPYFAYKGDPNQVPLSYVLFQQNAGVVDPSTNIRYPNMLYAQVDAVYSALYSLGFANIVVTVSETGWPSGGDADEAGATPQNAQTYNGNLIQLLAQNQGTPLRPKLNLQAYIFALFNEDMKPGPTSERNYGLFEPSGSPVYNVGLVGKLSTGNTGSTVSNGSTGTAENPSNEGPMQNNYYPPSNSPEFPYYNMGSAKSDRSVEGLIYLISFGISWFLLY